MRRDAAKARDYAERHGVPRWTTDADEVMLADDVDAVYVATPPSSHAEYVAPRRGGRQAGVRREADGGATRRRRRPWSRLRRAPACRSSWPTTGAPCRASSRP
jgi:hypothetical protein